ncbi:amidohydrolase family protein [Poseidonocella sedimentorum]|uniref:Amidohydrolase n=1 Tax=Poseidonocella sedimentorum TaxID=871652 RepID=A0A1I6CR03_9RHOB|nr:amidohydrolase family protein [Poseidonocella sedimentorum]SFQ95604.1 Amidohydrolase [Poseidonocella sedimentorum]
MTVTRRGFMAGGLALSGCAPFTYQDALICEPPIPEGPIRIDMHCHLLNMRDASEGPFVARRIFNLEEDAAPAVENIAVALTEAIASILGVGTWGIQREREYLRVELNKPLDLTPEGGRKPARQSNRDFCFFAGNTQPGIFRASAERQITGFFSTRIRNAARMMTLFPDIDIFLPSIVDLYEGPKIADYMRQIAFYSDLALATRGRFLPLASFTPEREYEDRELFGRSPDDPTRPSQMFWLKRAIDHLGFVGVKLHPSSGFSPHDNLRWGCLNTPRQRIRESDRDLYAQFDAYDGYMDELFAFCKSRDVPVLTHNSDGLSANRRCMQGAQPEGHGARQLAPTGEMGDPALGEWTYAARGTGAFETRAEEDWTNAPGAWIAAKEAADTAHPGAPLKVILSHLANAFDHLRRGPDQVELRPSRWLEIAAEATRRHPDLYIDLSEINEFFAPGMIDGHRELLRRLLRDTPGLEDHIMYGSDWHMPATALTGAEYPALIESLLPAAARPDVMGRTAARVFGLRPGGQTRARLARFFADPPSVLGTARPADNSLPLSEIPWWTRV